MGPAALLALTLAAAAPAPSAGGTGQEKADYDRWAAQPGHAAAVDRFRDYLRRSGVDGVVPTYQLLRTATAWRECRAAPFAVAPPALWPALARTLQLIRDEVKPAIGQVEAVSGYRDPALNRCSHGAPASAHARFQALDLTPAVAMTRAAMIARICRLHAGVGPRWHWGLGFYSGLRFHVDTRRHRRWGADGRGATSPCAGYDRRG